MSIQIKNTKRSYGLVSQLLHWGMALLVIATFVSGVVFSEMSRSHPMFRDVIVWHKSLGVSVFALVCFRIIWRLINPSPSLPDEMPKIQRWIAFLGHWALYACMVALPVTGIGSSFMSGRDVPFFFISSIPPFFSVTDYDLANTLIGMHHFITKVFLALFILHVMAAIKHHFWNKDDILIRMLDIRQPFFRFFK